MLYYTVSLGWSLFWDALEEEDGWETYLTSAKVEGRSTIRAPPNRGVLLNVAMFGFECWADWKFVVLL